MFEDIDRRQAGVTGIFGKGFSRYCAGLAEGNKMGKRTPLRLMSFFLDLF